MADLFLQASEWERVFAGVVAEIISAKREEKSIDRRRSLRERQIGRRNPCKKTSSHAETCEDVGGAVRGESASANRLQKLRKVTWCPRRKRPVRAW